MKIEDYVSYDVAKLLKEKEIRVVSDHYYYTENIKINGRRSVPKEVLTTAYSICDDFRDVRIFAPSLYDVQKWLKENLNIFICVHPRDFMWDYTIYDLNYVEEQTNLRYHKILCNMGPYNSYEEALNAGIKEALNYI